MINLFFVFYNLISSNSYFSVEILQIHGDLIHFNSFISGDTKEVIY